MKNFFYILLTALLLTACDAHDGIVEDIQEQQREAVLYSDVEDFEVVYDNEPSAFAPFAMTRATLDGKGFRNNDLIRLKITCPFTSTTQRGESSDGNSSDGFFLLYRNGSGWSPVTSSFGFDISGSYSYRDSPNFASYYEAQQTPYVFTAITWTEEKLFMGQTGGTDAPTYSIIDQYCNVFHADQTKEENYLASDLMWAQTYMQTGAWNIHLGFQHKMARLEISIDDSELTEPNPDYDPNDPESSPTLPAPISDRAVLTLEGMPDIDQQEVIVGDYYADASKVNSNFGYYQKASCSYENHGKVIGVAVITDTDKRAKTWSLTGNPSCTGAADAVAGGDRNGTRWGTIPNTGIYTAHPFGEKKYLLIVPPCKLDVSIDTGKTSDDYKATFWLRDGERRYKVKMQRTEFAEGKNYKMILKIAAPTAGNDDGDNDDPDQGGDSN